MDTNSTFAIPGPERAGGSPTTIPEDIPERPDRPPRPAGRASQSRLTSIVFAAAVFGALAVLSLPLGHLIRSSLLPWSGGGILHGGSPHAGPPVRASGPTHPGGIGDGRGAGLRAVTGSTGFGGGSNGSGSGGGPGDPVPVPPVADEPRPGPVTGAQPGETGGGLRGQVSDLDLATVSLLSQLLGNSDLDQVLAQLPNFTDAPDATATLLQLAAQDRLGELQSRVTPAQLHRLLQDIRGALAKIVRLLPPEVRWEPLPTTASVGSGGPRPGAPSTLTSPRKMDPKASYHPRISRRARAVYEHRRRRRHHQ
jgi:hypothetical protein